MDKDFDDAKKAIRKMSGSLAKFGALTESILTFYTMKHKYGWDPYELKKLYNNINELSSEVAKGELKLEEINEELCREDGIIFD